MQWRTATRCRLEAEFTYPDEALRFIRVTCHSCSLQAGVGLTHYVYYRCGGSRGIEQQR